MCHKDVDLCFCDDQDSLEESDEKDETYQIIRHYLDDHVARQIIKTGLTLTEAQEHCKNPETSSSTCINPEGIFHTKKHGPWFDSYTTE